MDKWGSFRMWAFNLQTGNVKLALQKHGKKRSVCVGRSKWKALEYKFNNNLKSVNSKHKL